MKIKVKIKLKIMMKFITQTFFVVAMGAVFSGCVTTRDQLNEERGIGPMMTRNSQDRENNIKSEDLTPKIKEEVKLANVPAGPQAQVAPLMAAPPAPLPDVANFTPDELRVEVARLTGRVEELEHEKQATDQSRTDETKKFESRIAELEKKLKELQPDPLAIPEGKTLFEAGKDAFVAQKCDEAISFLSRVLEKADAGKEAEEATFLRAECYFKKTQYNKAIVEFSRFPEKYQKSVFHPKALLRIAESFQAMGRNDDAKAFYSDLFDKFPKTAEGKLAKKRLKEKT